MLGKHLWKSATLPLLALGPMLGGPGAGTAQEAGASSRVSADTTPRPKPLRWGTGAWMFNIYQGQFNDTPEWRPDHLADQLRRDALFGGRIGYNAPFNLFIQAEASNTLLVTRLSPADGKRNTNLFLLGGALGYNFQPTQNLQIFPMVGLGAAIFSPDGMASESDFTVEYGGGFRYFLNSSLAIRGDVRWHQIPNAMQDIRDRLAGTPVPHPTLWGLELSSGLSLLVGGPSDHDHDNVDDAHDACPDTPPHTPVDLRGCPLQPGLAGPSTPAPGVAPSPKPHKWGTGTWIFDAHVGQFSAAPAWEPDHVPGQLRRGALFGGRVGYIFPSNFTIEAEVSNALLQTRLSPTDSLRSLNLYMVSPALSYNIQPTQKLQIFPSVGVGAALFKPDPLPSETDLALEVGGGFRYFVSPKVAVRGDVRWHEIPSAMQSIRDRLAGAPVPHPTLSGLELSAGLTIALSGPSDSDHDGVPDDEDACQDTPRGLTVDSRGCPADDDLDDVANAVDRCPNTPSGAIVDATGCPEDSDGDKVYDGIDRCPNTPPGAIVDATGCPEDSDGDKVYDGIDRCPNTPPGQPVDIRGCPRSVPLPPSPPVRLDSLGVRFDFNESTLRPGSSTALDSIGGALARMPGVRVEIRGYTDSIGPASYNEDLSRRRAETVRDYLLQHFPSLDGSRFTVTGFGESDPVASNATSAGRARNRRVMLIVHQGQR